MDKVKELVLALSQGLKPWMRFVILLAGMFLFSLYYLKGDIVEYAKYRASLQRKYEPINLEAAESVIIQEQLKTLATNVGSDGAAFFAYQPLHNIQTKSLISAFQKPGILILNPVKFSDIPVTVDAGEFIAMKNLELYRFGEHDLQGSPVWGRMLHQGVEEVFSYPIYSDGILYGHLSVVYSTKCCSFPVHYVKENLRTTGERIIKILKL